MIALQIKSIKAFMSKLLSGDCFAPFLLEEAAITTFNTFTIDGRQVKEFYSSEEWEDSSIRPYDFSEWMRLQEFIFSLIKGTHTPVQFKIVLHLKPEQITSILEKGDTQVTDSQIRSFVLTIKYDGTRLMLVTGTAYHSFVMDKSPDVLWDNAMRRFLLHAALDYEEL